MLSATFIYSIVRNSPFEHDQKEGKKNSKLLLNVKKLSTLGLEKAACLVTHCRQGILGYCVV
jgi:hypothetical protein